MKVRVGGGSTTLELPVSKFVPGIFETVLPDSRKIAVLMRPDGTYVGAQNPAHKGEIITMFMTGLGAVNPVTGTNVAGIGGQTVVAQIIVGINNEGVRVVSKEYFPGMVGLYIVRFEVPQSAPSQWDVKLSMGVVDGDNVVYGNDTIIPIL